MIDSPRGTRRTYRTQLLGGALAENPLLARKKSFDAGRFWSKVNNLAKRALKTSIPVTLTW